MACRVRGIRIHHQEPRMSDGDLESLLPGCSRPLEGSTLRVRSRGSPEGSALSRLQEAPAKTPPPLLQVAFQCNNVRTTRRAELWWTDDMLCINYLAQAWTAQRDATDLPSFRSCRRGISSSDTCDSRSPFLHGDTQPSILGWDTAACFCVHTAVSPLSCFVLLSIYKYIHTHMYTYVCIYTICICTCVSVYMRWGRGERENYFEIPSPHW